MARMRAAMTPQMKRVYALLSEEKVHLSAEEILHRVDVSRPTVYRALDRLTEEGLIRRLSLEGDKSVYECVRDGHAHFLCRKCNQIYDLEMGEWVDKIAWEGGHQVEKTDITVYGICSNCLKDNEE